MGWRNEQNQVAKAFGVMLRKHDTPFNVLNFLVLGIKPWTSHILSKHCTTELGLTSVLSPWFDKLGVQLVVNNHVKTMRSH
jgi:hypothetical protein